MPPAQVRAKITDNVEVLLEFYNYPGEHCRLRIESTFATVRLHHCVTKGPGSRADHNQADITFVQGMIPHHEQAVEMSELAANQASSPQVKELAATIERGQAPEIEQMRAMLAAWGVAEDSSMAAQAVAE